MMIDEVLLQENICSEEDYEVSPDDFDVDVELGRMMEEFRKLSAEERAYCVIKSYFGIPVESLTERSRASFDSWLVAPENEEAVSKALERVFFEIVEMNGE